MIHGINKRERYKVATVLDEAIDWAASETTVGLYEHQHGLDQLVVKPGQKLTVFEFRPLLLRERAAIEATAGTAQSPLGKAAMTVKLALTGIEGFEGVEVTWDKDGKERHVSEETLECMPDDLVLELGRKIWRAAELTEAERGN